VEFDGSGSRKSGGTSELGEIELVNTTAVAGPAVAEVVVPLQFGDFSKVPFVVTKGNTPCQVFAMGSRFDDGSLRYLRLEVPTVVNPNERLTIGLLATGEEPPPFVKHASITGTIGVDARLRVGKKTFDFPAPKLIESGPVTQVYRSRLRATGSMIWAELTVSLYSNTRHSKFTLQWGNSDPDNSELYEDPGQVEFQIQGPEWEFEQPGKILRKGLAETWRLALLHDGGQISDGQSQILEGRFLYEA